MTGLRVWRVYLDLPDAQPVPEFNLSHSGEWGLVAVAGRSDGGGWPVRWLRVAPGYVAAVVHSVGAQVAGVQALN